MKHSLWSATADLPEFEKLDKDIRTDVLIIGGGLCGVLCAYFLEKASVPYVLVEGNKIASGITKNTTAKITAQHGLIYRKIIDTYGKEKAKMYFDINNKALKEYEKLSKNLSCDFERMDACTYSMNDRKIIEKEVLALNSLGIGAEFQEKSSLPFDIQGLIRLKNQAQFHPLKFIGEISKGLNIYENTFVRELTPTYALTDGGKIYAKKIIVATHFPFINKHGGYFLKLYQHRSYVSAYKGAPVLDAMYVDENNGGLSFRNYGEYLLVGGGGHRTGKKGSAWEEIHNFKNKHFPRASLEYEWAAQDCMSLDSIPYIGLYSQNTPEILVATGFNKWGITGSMAAAMLLSNTVQERKNEYDELFSPQRSILHPQILINGFEATANILSFSKKRCPHLGCALKWNKAEHTWDCPCHGSRFEEDGTLIDNPATGDLR